MQKQTIENLTRGIIKENPIFVMLLGMCPTLGVTTSADNGLGMGLATMFSLIFSNICISLTRNIIPAQIRIPCFILIIATVVTVIEIIIKAYFPVLYEQLGVFIPLIVVNCIVLGRAEAFASKNNVQQSILDAVGMGLGFTLALVLLGTTREVFGSGSIFGFNLVGQNVNTILFLITPPGAFLALAGLIVLMNKVRGAK